MVVAGLSKETIWCLKEIAVVVQALLATFVHKLKQAPNQRKVAMGLTLPVISRIVNVTKSRLYATQVKLPTDI